MKKLGNIIIPAVTPFDEDGTLRLDWLKENYANWNRTDIGGIMALGSNGEFRSLNDDEAFAVIQTGAESISPDKVFIAGIGRESLQETLAFLKRLEDARLAIDYVSVLTPCYFKSLMTDEALIGYFTAVADASSYPVLLYCAPGFANGVVISPEALKVLADHPNIKGIKDTTKDMMNAYMDAVGGRDDFDVLSGSLGSIMICMERGGKGGVISSANYFPQACSRLCRILKEEGVEAARAYHAVMKETGAGTGGKASVAGVKATMNLMGYKGGFPRRPVLPCGEELVCGIRAYIEAHEDLLGGDRVGS